MMSKQLEVLNQY